jgi:AcrR family transcriptional regulator
MALKKTKKKPTPEVGRGKYDRSLPAHERQKEQRQRLFAAAAEVVAELGYAGSTVEAIVVRAKMSRRTFYEHFADLKDALLQLHDYAAEVAFQTITEKIASEPDPVEQLNAGVSAFLSTLASQGDLARVIFREIRSAGPEYEARRMAVLDRFQRLLAAGVERAYQAGIASRPPDELTIFALVSALEAVGMRYVERREEARALEAAPKMVELIFRAFR